MRAELATTGRLDVQGAVAGGERQRTAAAAVARAVELGCAVTRYLNDDKFKGCSKVKNIIIFLSSI